MSPIRPPVPLTIAGSDPSGGAGLQADLKVFMHFGLSGAAVPTAITVQSASGVRSYDALSGSLVTRQLNALLVDLRPVAVKVGMLGSGEVVRAVARALAPLARRRIPIVVDPVLASSDGRRLLPAADVPVFLRQLVPLATLITPNLAEAGELTGVSEAEVQSRADHVVSTLLRSGAKAVLIKGGHVASDEATDVLGTREDLTLFSLPRIPHRRHVHGTGCALSAAIAALLGQGRSLDDAVQGAKEYVHAALSAARHVGRGARVLDFFVAQEG
jgi:hydroxymethylpyrimidine kinase/phosphomethylpyrimidine kinase